MSKRGCPLGEDCDLTLAWMMGAEDARDKTKARIEALEAKLAKAVDETLDAASAYMKKQYGIGALSHPVDRARIIAELKGDKP